MPYIQWYYNNTNGQNNNKIYSNDETFSINIIVRPFAVEVSNITIYVSSIVLDLLDFTMCL